MRRPSRNGRGFDFTHHIRRLCEDMVRRLPELSHIDMRRVAVSFCQARKASPYGLWATLTPLRFEGGARAAVRRGRKWTVGRLCDSGGREMLYILSFYLPRFMDQPLTDKLITILHELWHIGPDFDGDLRRHSGRCYAHGSSQQKYDAAMQRLARKYLTSSPAPETYDFLTGTFADLRRRHGSVYGTKIAAPKLIPA